MQRRISLMSEHIKDQVIDQAKPVRPEAGRVLGCFVLRTTNSIRAHIYNGEFLCIINLSSRTREEDIYQFIDTYFKSNEMKWKPMRGLCTGVASAMLGHSSGVYR